MHIKAPVRIPVNISATEMETAIMFKKIMVPVDLAHADSLTNAIEAAASLAERKGVEVIMAGVTMPQPSSVAHNPAEYAQKLAEFAKTNSKKLGVHFEPVSAISHDVAIDLDKTLLEMIAENSVDLVVMASHKPGMMEHIFASNAGYLANHAPVSVLVVR